MEKFDSLSTMLKVNNQAFLLFSLKFKIIFIKIFLLSNTIDYCKANQTSYSKKLSNIIYFHKKIFVFYWNLIENKNKTKLILIY